MPQYYDLPDGFVDKEPDYCFWCYWCDGSGQGYGPDTNCRACSGLGRPEVEYEPE